MKFLLILITINVLNDFEKWDNLFKSLEDSFNWQKVPNEVSLKIYGQNPFINNLIYKNLSEILSKKGKTLNAVSQNILSVKVLFFRYIYIPKRFFFIKKFERIGECKLLLEIFNGKKLIEQKSINIKFDEKLKGSYKKYFIENSGAKIKKANNTAEKLTFLVLSLILIYIIYNY